MAIDHIHTVITHVYECERCGRMDESARTISQCEAECAEAAARGEVRVFLPPPGRYDPMFDCRWWRFVPRDSAQVKCAREGHDLATSYKPTLARRRLVSADPFVEVSVPREIEVATCRRCGERAVPFQAAEIDAALAGPRCEGDGMTECERRAVHLDRTVTGHISMRCCGSPQCCTSDGDTWFAEALDSEPLAAERAAGVR